MTLLADEQATGGDELLDIDELESEDLTAGEPGAGGAAASDGHQIVRDPAGHADGDAGECGAAGGN